MAKLVWRCTVLVWLLFGLAGPASADWQYTNWGMSPEEVAQVAKKAGDAVREIPEAEQFRCSVLGAVCEVNIIHKDGDLTFDVSPQFDPKTNRLVVVSMSLKEPNSGRHLLNQLTAQYGAPISVTTSAIGSESEWQTSTDRIVFDLVITGGHDAGGVLVYRPLKDNPNPDI